MVNQNTMQIVAACHDGEAARRLVAALGGVLLIESRIDEGQHIPGLPCAALACVVTDRLSHVAAVADAGLYLACRRVIKPRVTNDAGRQPGVVGVFPMIARPDVGPENADLHWRDQHAPLALDIHKVMDSYVQLSVVHCFQGAPWNGIALCGCPSLDALRNHFIETDADQRAITNDIRQFADLANSPRRLIATEYRLVQGSAPG